MKSSTEPLGIWSVSQTWAPGLAMDAGHLVRPRLLMLVSETMRQPVARELLSSEMGPDALALWLKKQFAQNGTPSELLVQNEVLQSTLRFRLSGTKVRVVPEPEFMSSVLAFVAAHQREHVTCSLVDKLGILKAVETLEAAARFMAADPWEKLQNTVLRYQGKEQEYGVVVIGSELPSRAFPHRGFLLYNSVAEAVVGGRAVGYFGNRVAQFVHFRDLNLSDQRCLKLPYERYAGFHVPGRKMTNNRLQDLVWLVKQLPLLTQAAITDHARRLERTESLAEDGWLNDLDATFHLSGELPVVACACA